MKSRLGVNVDHIATLRNARGEGHPNPISYARQVMNFGANSITCLLYTSPSPRDRTRSRMPSSA